MPALSAHRILHTRMPLGVRVCVEAAVGVPAEPIVHSVRFKTTGMGA